MANFTAIEEKLLEKVVNSSLRTSLAMIREAAEKIWAADAPRVMQDFTDHGITHSERLATFAAKLLEANDGKSLSAQEMYLLLAGIYLHDIGMQCDIVRMQEIGKGAEKLGALFDVKFTAKTASDYSIEEQKAIRKNHQYLTAAWIDYALRENKTSVGPAANTIPEELVGDLMDVCMHHAKVPITNCPLTFKFDQTQRKQLVAALLRFADELDVDGHRVTIDTVKNFRLDPRNSIYWWLHNLTKVIFVARNVILLTIRLHPQDFKQQGPFVHGGFITEFQTKNRPVLGVLQQNSIPVAISAESGVLEDEYAEGLPTEVVQVLLAMQQRPDPLRELADEVATWLQAIRYEVSDPALRDERTVDLLAMLDAGSVKQQVLVRCIGGEIGASDVDKLDNVLDRKTPQGWLISDQRVTKTARERAAMDDAFEVFSLADFLREKVWGPYFDWLESLVEKDRIPDLYVDLGCYKQQMDERGEEVARERYESLDAHVDDWLKERGKMHMSLLGEFGSGKTWFCRHYAYRQLDRYLEDPGHERLPLLITLRAFTKALTAEQLVNDALLEQYKLPFVGSAYDVFREMNRRGKLLLILDGFDEMARQVDYQTVVDNFWELAKLVELDSKVVLTSRTEYFRWAKESEKILGGTELGRRTIKLSPPRFEVLHLDPLTDEQMTDVIKRRLGDEAGSNVAIRILESGDLAEMASKPVLLGLLLAALDEVHPDVLDNPAQVYLYATNKLLLRNIDTKRTFTTTGDKVYFLCELAWEMIRGGTLRTHYTDIPDRIKDYFGKRIRDQHELDNWDFDLRNQTLLHRNAAGYYEFAHNSLAEYFVAFKFAAELGCLTPVASQTYREADGEPCRVPIVERDIQGLSNTFGALPLGSPRLVAVRQLLSGIMQKNFDKLWQLYETAREFAAADLHETTGNLLCVLADLGANFAGRDLSCLDLSHTSYGIRFRGLDLQGADLSHSKFFGTSFALAKLKGANLEDAHLLHGAGIPVMYDVTGTNDFAFLGNTEVIAAVGWNQVVFWDMSDQRHIEPIDLPQDAAYVTCLEASLQGHLVCAACGRTLMLWRTSGERRCTKLVGHRHNIRGVAFSPDGRYLVSFTDALTSSDEILLWDLERNQMRLRLQKGHGGTFGICFSADSSSLVVGGRDGLVRVFDSDSGHLRTTISKQELGKVGFVYQVSLSTNGRLLAIACSAGNLIIWDMMEQRVVHQIGPKESYYTSVTFSSNGRHLAAVSEGKTYLFLCDSWRRVYSSPVGFTRAKLRTDGKYLAMGPGFEDAHIIVLDVESGMSVWDHVYRADFSGMNIRNLQAPFNHLRFFRERGAQGYYTHQALEQMTEEQVRKLARNLSLHSQEKLKRMTKSDIISLILKLI